VVLHRVPGIGVVTTSTLLVDLPELGTLNRDNNTVWRTRDAAKDMAKLDAVPELEILVAVT